MTRLFVCGDILNYEKSDGIICSSELSTIIKESDYSICNFEAPVKGVGKRMPKSGPHHHQRGNTLKGLKKQGFDMICLANNHIMDFGRDALKSTIEEGKQENFDIIGAGLNFDDAYRPVIKKLNNKKIGFINAGEAQFGVIDYYAQDHKKAGYAWINHCKIDQMVIALKKECDVVIILSHAGLEHYHIPQKEWRRRYKFLCDIGADAVIGSHPHVPQGYEKHNDSFIFYSLGNFYFDSKNHKDKKDATYSLVLDITEDNKIEVTPIFHHKEDGLVQLSNNAQKINLEGLNQKLVNGYERLHDEMSLKVYSNKIKRNLIYSLLSFPYDGHAKSTVKRIVKTLFIKNREKEILTLHLLRNEAYYYASRHALELISEKKLGVNKDE